jgi:hypothetical protein
MRIKINQTIKHSGRPYAANDELTVDDGLGAYFCSCGWATRLDGDGPPAAPQPEHVTLDVQSGRIGHKAQEA